MNGNPASISDVGVGLLAVRACIEGAAMNVRINLSALKDEAAKSSLAVRVDALRKQSNEQFKKSMQLVESKLG
jgi:formiminotetrahydrofolate cyclodeaminase